MAKSLRQQAEDNKNTFITMDDLEYSSTPISKEDKEIAKQQWDTEQYLPYFSSFDELGNFVLYEMNTRFKYLLEIDENYYMCNFRRGEFLQKEKTSWRSNIKSLLTNMFVNRVVSMVMEFDKSFSVLDKKAEQRDEDEIEAMKKSKKIVDELTVLIDHTISDKDNANAIADWLKDTIKDGFSSQKVGIDIRDKVRKYKVYGNDWEVNYKKEIVSINYVSNYNVFYSYGSNRRIKFIAERLLLTDKEIIANYVDKYSLKYEPKQWEKNEYKILIRHDYESIKQSLLFYNYKNSPNVVSGTKGSTATGQNIDDAITPEVNWKNIDLDKIFSIKQNSKLREVYEVYHDEEDGLYMDVYVNWLYLWTALCNTPLEWYNHFRLTYRRIPWSIDGMGIGTVCMPIQKAYDAILNLRIDNVNVNTNTVYLKRRWLNIWLGNGNVAITPWMTLEVDDKNDVTVLQRTSVPPEAYEEPNSLFSMLQGAIGISGYWLWVQGRVERVSWQSEMLKQAQDDQLNEFIEVMNKYFWWLATNIIIYYKTVISKATVEKLLWKDNLFMKEPIEDILENISWSFDITSQQAKYNATLTQILINFLWVAGNLVDENGKKVANVREIVLEIAKRQGIDGSTILWDQDFVSTIWQATNAMGITDTSGLVPAVWVEWGEAITALNQFWWAGDMGELAPNAWGVN